MGLWVCQGAFLRPFLATSILTTLHQHHPRNSSTTTDQRRPPRVAILNREGTRKLLNAESLVTALKTSTSLNPDIDIPIVYFEQFDFEQQTAFFTLLIF
jgi:hypothetical protein